MSDNPVTPEALERLERAAKAATPGPWAKRESKDGFTSVCYGDGVTHPAEFIWQKSAVTSEIRETDGAFIAEANPAAILALLASFRTLESENRSLKSCGMIELMMTNPNADSFVREKESHIAELESENRIAMRALINHSNERIVELWLAEARAQEGK